MITKNDIIKKEVDNTHYYFVNNEWYPAVTKILEEASPMSFGLKQFFINNTAESAKEISNTALDLGSKMHDAYERLLNGLELNLVEDYKTIKEKKHILSFYNWCEEVKPQVIETEMVVASESHRYAGTLDLACLINNEIWIIDFKTSAAIYFDYELQIAAYKKAFEEMGLGTVAHTAVLRTGTQHKIGYEFKELKAPFEAFGNVYQTYLNLHGGVLPKPPLIDIYPETIKLNMEAYAKN
jgi:hypothetical protein